MQPLKGYVLCCCRDNAIHLVSDHIPPMTVSDRREALLAATKYLLAHGEDYTGGHNRFWRLQPLSQYTCSARLQR